MNDTQQEQLVRVVLQCKNASQHETGVQEGTATPEVSGNSGSDSLAGVNTLRP